MGRRKRQLESTPHLTFTFLDPFVLESRAIEDEPPRKRMRTSPEEEKKNPAAVGVEGKQRDSEEAAEKAVEKRKQVEVCGVLFLWLESPSA